MSGRLSNQAQNDLMLLLFNNTAWSTVGGSGGIPGSSPAGSFYCALHTADPTAAGNQSSSEAAYTGYARQAVARSSGGWTVSGSSPTSATNTAAITFPLCTGGAETETWFSIGVSPSGATEALFQGPLSPSLNVSNGIIPSFAIAACVCTMD